MKKVEGIVALAALLGTVQASAQARDIEAGPLWNQGHAQQRCPDVCRGAGASWNGQWRTTIQGRMSVCGCVPPTAVMVAPAQPFAGPGPVMVAPPPVAVPAQGLPMAVPTGTPMPVANACAWPDGQDPSFPSDPGRGVSDWSQHYGFVAGGGRGQVPEFVGARMDALRGCLPPPEYARLYADLSTQIAYYGRTWGGWVDGSDPRGGQDGGRGVAAWRAHMEFAQNPGRAGMASVFVRQRLGQLGAVLPPDVYGRLYADVSLLTARFARAR